MRWENQVHFCLSSYAQICLSALSNQCTNWTLAVHLLARSPHLVKEIHKALGCGQMFHFVFYLNTVTLLVTEYDCQILFTAQQWHSLSVVFFTSKWHGLDNLSNLILKLVFNLSDSLTIPLDIWKRQSQGKTYNCNYRS